MTLKNTFLLAAGMTLAGLGITKNGDAQTSQKAPATYNEAVYYNLHYQADKHVGVGLFTGPVVNLANGNTSVEANFYAGYKVTGQNAPLNFGVGMVAGVSFSKDGAFKYAAPNMRFGTNIAKDKKLAFLNNLYLISSLPVTDNFKQVKQPNLMLGFIMPFGKHKTSSVWFETQRHPN